MKHRSSHNFDLELGEVPMFTQHDDGTLTIHMAARGAADGWGVNIRAANIDEWIAKLANARHELLTDAVIASGEPTDG